MEEQSDTPRTDATQYQWTRTLDLARDLERELATATRERDEARARVADLVENGERLKAIADAAVRDAEDMAEAKCALLRDRIERHVAEAVAREREECARACEDVEAPQWDEYVASYNGAVVDCVAAIRARAEKEAK